MKSMDFVQKTSKLSQKQATTLLPILTGIGNNGGVT